MFDMTAFDNLLWKDGKFSIFYPCLIAEVPPKWSDNKVYKKWISNPILHMNFHVFPYFSAFYHDLWRNVQHSHPCDPQLLCPLDIPQMGIKLKYINNCYHYLIFHVKKLESNLQVLIIYLKLGNR